jgi:hypothetical protein
MKDKISDRREEAHGLPQPFLGQSTLSLHLAVADDENGFRILKLTITKYRYGYSCLKHKTPLSLEKRGFSNLFMAPPLQKGFRLVVSL